MPFLSHSTEEPEIVAALRASGLPDRFDASTRWVAEDFTDTSQWGPEAVLRWLETRCDFARTKVLKRSDQSRRPERLGSFRDATAALAADLSVQVNNFHLTLPDDDPLRRLLRAVEQAVRLPIEAANLFFTPPGKKSTPLHHDPFDVFTVHIFGRKDWSVWDTNQLQGCVESLPDETVSLSAGSLFYLPAFQPHSVIASAENSISVGCAFQCRTLVQLLERLSRHPDIAPHVNRNLPPISAGNHLHEEWQRLTSALAAMDKLKVVQAAMAVRNPNPTRKPEW